MPAQRELPRTGFLVGELASAAFIDTREVLTGWSLIDPTDGFGEHAPWIVVSVGFLWVKATKARDA